MLTFEVVVYNEAVRQLVREGESHKRYTDDWGDSHYVDIRAETEDDAMAKARVKFPAEDGFVIEGISEA